MRSQAGDDAPDDGGQAAVSGRLPQPGRGVSDGRGPACAAGGPASTLVMQAMPRMFGMPAWRATRTSGTVDIPTASAPILRSIRISAAVS